MAGRRRGGRCEAELHAEAQRLLAEADDPARVKQTILMALRGGRPVQQQCLICGKVAQHGQIWVPMERTQAVPDLTAKPSIDWLCDRHHGQGAKADIVARRAQQGRGGMGARSSTLVERSGDAAEGAFYPVWGAVE
jgi:hypothetical protein